jgi:hypothetical protein
MELTPEMEEYYQRVGVAQRSRGVPPPGFYGPRQPAGLVEHAQHRMGNALQEHGLSVPPEIACPLITNWLNDES